MHAGPPPSLSLSLSLASSPPSPLPSLPLLHFRPPRLDPRRYRILSAARASRPLLFRRISSRSRGENRGFINPEEWIERAEPMSATGPTVGILRWPLPFGSPSASPDTFVYALDIHGCAHAVNMPAYMREWTGSSSRSPRTYARAREDRSRNEYIYIYVRTRNTLVG